jgi:beta-phosphoglucomutase-like phosphatase (HAD superfamily)
MGAIDADRLAAHWAWALDAAGRAVDACGIAASAEVLAAERRRLTEERPCTARLLAHLGNGAHPWLPPGPVTPRLLGLPDGVTAVYADVEGILTDAGVLHAAAWAETLEPVLVRHSSEPERPFAPFTVADYRAYLEGRPREAGLELFLAGRGIRLERTEVHRLAERKGAVLERRLHRRHAAALPGARRFLQVAAAARLDRFAVSASTNARRMIDLAGLAPLVDSYVPPERVAEAHPGTAAVVTLLPLVAGSAREAGLAVLSGPLLALLDPRVRGT